MPTCKKCDSDFPNTKVIDGKRYYLHRRAYCIDCNPIGETPKEYATKDKVRYGATLVCGTCSKDFVWRRGSTTKTKCHSCVSRDYRRKRKQKAVDYKGGSCIVCGYNKYIGALEFHHLNPEEKDIDVSRLNDSSWETMKAELDKCVLLCANCHREVENGLVKL